MDSQNDRMNGTWSELFRRCNFEILYPYQIFGETIIFVPNLFREYDHLQNGR